MKASWLTITLTVVLGLVLGDELCKVDQVDGKDTEAITDGHGEDRVQNQYLEFPYPPPPDPRLEKIFYEKGFHFRNFRPALVLEELNHYLYQGKQDFRSGFRVLDAAGGTGGATLFLAEELNNTNTANIVYLDFSKTSMEIARERARVRRLDNIVWVNDWIENIPHLGLGKFDLIECSAALHHLKDPLGGSVLC